MDAISPLKRTDRKPVSLSPVPLRTALSTAVEQNRVAPTPHSPLTQGAGEGLSALLSGLQQNFSSESPEEGAIDQASEKVEKVSETVSTPTNQAATLSRTISEGKPAEKLAQTATRLGGQTAGGTTSRALQGLNSVSNRTGKLGESAFVVAKPFSIANGVKKLATGEAQGEELATTSAGLASDVGYTARTLGAAAEGGSGASKVSALASVQGKLLQVAPKAAGALATVGKAAPVLGGAAGVLGGGLDIKDAVSGDKVDKPKLASGGLKVASGVALAIPGGLPVAMGLGATALAIDGRDDIAKGAKKVAGAASDIAGGAADVAKSGVTSIGKKLVVL